MIAGIGRVSGVSAWWWPTTPTVKGGTYPLTVRSTCGPWKSPGNRLALRLSGRFRRRLPAHAGRGLPDKRSTSGRIFFNQANLSAGASQIAAVMGSCTAGGAYVPAMCDESIIVKNQGTFSSAARPGEGGDRRSRLG